MPGFSSPPDPKAYNAVVWEIVRQIPPGKVCTYGQIAGMIPPPGGMSLRDYEAFGARWVGGAMAACPDDVPWQRVINSQGKISLRRGGLPNIQKELLEAEGVAFDERERVDLDHYRWAGPGREWLRAHNLFEPLDPKNGDPQLKMGI
jgi:methylated-DNA-protein-cysteine methyltransferase-like protein